MGIGSYKEAERYRMRANKNLTRSFYLDTRRTLDEEPFAWEQPQDAGIMQPGAVQEFSDGGRVGFQLGGESTRRMPYEGTRKMPENIRKKLDIAKLEINRRNDLGILSRAEDISKISNIELRQVNSYIQNKLLPPLITKEEAIIKYINNALENNSPLIDFKTENILDYLNHDLPKGSRGKVGFNTLKNTIKDMNPELYDVIFSQEKGTQYLIKGNPRVHNLKIKDYLRDPNSIKAEQAILSSNIYSKRDKLRILEGKLKLGLKDFAISQAQDIYVKELNENIRQQVKEIGYDEWVKRNSDLVEYAGLRFDNKTNQFVQRSPQELQKYIDDGFFSIDHKNKKSGGKINIEYPTNKQIVPAGINSGYIRSTQTYLKNNIDKYGKDLNTTRTINDIVDKAKKFDFTIGMDEVPNYQESVLAKKFKGIKNIGGTQYPTVNENVLTGFDEQLKKFNLDTSTVSKNVTPITQEELLKTKDVMKGRIQNIESILNKAGVTNEESKAINLISNQLHLSNQLHSGINPELFGKLYSKEINLVTNAAKKLASSGINTADLLFSFGNTPAGRVAGGAFVGLLAAPELSKGNYKQAVRDVTPWFESLKIPKTDIDIGIGSKQGDLIKYAGEKNYGQDSLKKIYQANDIQNEIDSLTSKIKNLKNQTYTEDPLSGGYTNFEDIIKQSQLELNDLEQKKKELNIQKSDWQNLFNSSYSFNEDRYLSHKQNFFGKNILSRTGKDEDVIEKELFNDIRQLNPNLLNQFNIAVPEEDYQEEEQPLQEDYSYVSAAEGGRIGYKDGTEDPNEKPIIPIDPLSDEIKPTNIMDTKLTRRQILGGIGAAAGVPIVAKLIKEGKAIKAARVAKVATKILPNVHGMPEWFPSLVSKINKEGKYPPKDIGLGDNLKIRELTIPSKTGKGGDEVYTMIEYPNGRIEIQVNLPNRGAFGEPFELHYNPPESFVDETTGKAVNVPGDFSVVEQRPRVTGGPHDADWELDWENLSKDQALSDIEAVEKTATGKIANPKEAKARASQRDYYYDNPYEDIVDRYGDVGLHYDDIAKE